MVRAERIFNDRKRIAEKYKNLAEVAQKIKERRDRDRDRYMERYEYNVDDTSIYDFKIDTEFLAFDEVVNKVIDYVAKRLKTLK